MTESAAAGGGGIEVETPGTVYRNLSPPDLYRQALCRDEARTPGHLAPKRRRDDL
jgi:hypothetical protein